MAQAAGFTPSGAVAAGKILELRPQAQLRKNDVFDSPNFNPISFINQIYPEESSLQDLDKFIDVLRRQIRGVDKEIYQAVRAQGGAHTRARQELEAAQQQILELFDRVKEIQRKAEESETMVQEICKDIRKLDYAKKHLTNAITALRRMAMLTAAVADLESISGRRDSYKKSANLLEAVHQLMEYFQQYEDVPKVKGLAKRLAVIEQQLTDNVLDDFKLLMGTADVKVSPDNLDRLAAGCLVVDALGPKVRDQLLDWMCDREMNIYQTFSSSGGADVSKLDRFERRFHWFRTRMEERKAEWAVFPESWRVPQVLCLTFCKITKAHLKRILSDNEGAPATSGDIGPLIKAVVATNKFEKDMASTFGGGTDQGEDEDGAGGEGADEISASEARKRLERFRQRMKQEEARRQMDKMGDKARAEREAVRTTFEGAISDAFEGPLALYVAEEAKELGAYLEGLIKEEYENHWRPSDEEVESRILPSANKLFLKIRGSLTRCVKMISRGTTLLQLTEVFQKVLNSYAQALLARLPKTATGQTNVPPPYIGTDWYIRLTDEEVQVVCHILHTADFCRDTLQGLATAVQKDVKQALAERVDLGEEEGAFQGVSSACMSVLVLGINTQLDAALQEMARVRWDAIENPGDDSAYVLAIRKALIQELAPRLGASLDTTALAFMCDKMVRAFMPRFQEALSKCKRISEKGTLQLSVDCDAVRRTLHEFPRAARAAAKPHGDMQADLMALGIREREEDSDESASFASYNSYVEREMGGIINMVKVLQSKPEHLVDTFMLLMPASSQNMNEFVRVCDMKGLGRMQQQQLISLYQAKLSGESDQAAAARSGMPLMSTPLVSAAASNLGAFKVSMNNITALASNINFPLGKGNNPSSPSAGGKGLFSRTIGPSGLQGSGAGGGLHQRGASISAAAENVASKFAKVGNLMGAGITKIGNAFQSQDSGAQ